MKAKTIRIKKKLLDLGLTQTDLAKALNIPVQRVNDAIFGRRWGKKYLPQIENYIKHFGEITNKKIDETGIMNYESDRSAPISER